jgi:hypothetical protein
MARFMARFDPTSIDLTDVDLTRLDGAIGRALDAAVDTALDAARDAAYVTVGLSLLNFQRLQVRRREVERALRR